MTTLSHSALADTPLAAARDESERLAAFAAEIDAIRARVEAQVGAEDVAYMRRVIKMARTAEIVGRVLLHTSVEPVGFSLGVFASWFYRQLHAGEIGHTLLHGAFDRVAGAEDLSATSYRWPNPLDETSWRFGHNVLHHRFPNVVGRDPDITSDMFRLSPRVPRQFFHALQYPLLAFVVMPNFGFLLNLHYAGFNPAYRDQPDSWHRAARSRALRKYVRHYGREYVLFPLLAGPFAPKVALGNWLSTLCADIYTALTNYCGHLQGDAHDWSKEAKTTGRGDYYRMQVESTLNFEVSAPISLLCGGLDRQIEHHLFPRLPPNRLRQIAPEVKRACQTHGIHYRTKGWGTSIRAVFRHVAQLGTAAGRAA